MELKIFTAETILRSTRIKPWRHLKESQSIWDYLQHPLSLEDQSRIRFAPKVEVVTLENPKSSAPYEGWLSQATTWATVFALTPDNQVVITIEYKHGADEVMIGLPAGVGKSGELLGDVMRRELLEETGFDASILIPLGDHTKGAAASGRKSSDRFFSFLATDVKQAQDQSLDEDELIETGLVPLPEWMKMIELGIVKEGSAIANTLLALQKLKKI
jgi:8-oxo-dGTP pyrophosphatase MutT (NUDIX family)